MFFGFKDAMNPFVFQTYFTLYLDFTELLRWLNKIDMKTPSNAELLSVLPDGSFYVTQNGRIIDHKDLNLTDADNFHIHLRVLGGKGGTEKWAYEFFK